MACWRSLLALVGMRVALAMLLALVSVTVRVVEGYERSDYTYVTNGGKTVGILTLDSYDHRILIVKNNCPEVSSIKLATKGIISQTGDFVLEPKETIEVITAKDWGCAISGCTGSGCPADKMQSGECATTGCWSSGPPHTLIEAGFNEDDRWGGDFYDASLINGISVPLEYGPILDVDVTPSGWGGAWRCGKAGGVKPQTPNMPSCTWDFTPPTVGWKWVEYGSKTCVADSDCPAGQVCGTAFNRSHTPTLPQVCGKRLGYWAALEMCPQICKEGTNCQEVQPGVIDTPGCTQSTSWGPRVELYSCNKPPRCNAGAVNCCGCMDWSDKGIGIPSHPCDATNSEWVNGNLPNLIWIKKSCPSAYTYPADDPWSTFTCAAPVVRSGTKKNGAVYKLTMCPNHVWSGQGSIVCNATTSQNQATCTENGDCKWCSAQSKCVDWGVRCSTSGASPVIVVSAWLAIIALLLSSLN